MQPEEKQQLNKLVRDIEAITRELSDFMRKTDVDGVGISKDVEQIKKDITEIKLLVTQNYVRREDFNPVQKIVYGIVTVILMGVIGALMALVINKG